jgi:hypothetical protein
MKRTALFRLALIALVGIAIRHANGGSAVALAPHNKFVTSYGHTREIAKQKALDLARRKYGNDVRIVASSDVTGYCAIAIARHPNGYGWIIGISLGNPSATQADALAIEHCVKAGGLKPRVASAFRG